MQEDEHIIASNALLSFERSSNSMKTNGTSSRMSASTGLTSTSGRSNEINMLDPEQVTAEEEAETVSNGESGVNSTLVGAEIGKKMQYTLLQLKCLHSATLMHMFYKVSSSLPLLPLVPLFRLFRVPLLPLACVACCSVCSAGSVRIVPDHVLLRACIIFLACICFHTRSQARDVPFAHACIRLRANTHATFRADVASAVSQAAMDGELERVEQVRAFPKI